MSESPKILLGAKLISQFLFGDESQTHMSLIYKAAENGTMPLFRMGRYVAAYTAILEEWSKGKGVKDTVEVPVQQISETGYRIPTMLQALAQPGMTEPRMTKPLKSDPTIILVFLSELEISKTNTLTRENVRSTMDTDNLIRIERANIAFQKCFEIGDQHRFGSFFYVGNKAYGVKVTDQSDPWLKLETEKPPCDYYVQCVCNLETDCVELHGWASKQYFIENKVRLFRSKFKKGKYVWGIRELPDMSTFPLTPAKEEVYA